ncbi:unnamed protein product [Ascophyllum nodosum]
MEASRLYSLWLAFLFAWVALIMIIVWAVAYQDNDYFLGGLSFSGSGLFNWHPILMVAGFVVAYTHEGILAYRTLPLSKEINKMIHNALMFLAVVLISLALWAVFQYHNNELYANLYTVHSWAGIMIVTLFYANYLGGFFNFFAGLTPQWMTEKYMPRHVFIGIFTYFGAAFTCVLGIQDKNSALGCGYDITLTSPDYNPAAHYWNLYAGCRLSNGLGVVIILTCLLATYAVMGAQERRPPEGDSIDRPLI